jgi:hypothetical protein
MHRSPFAVMALGACMTLRSTLSSCLSALLLANKIDVLYANPIFVLV